MIIRATNKLLKISRITPVKDEAASTEVLPGEWYANTVKTGHTGKQFMFFFHRQTKISIICPTKSLNIAIKQLPEKVEDFLKRHNYAYLIERYKLNSDINIYTTNDRSTLAFMNQIAFNIEYNLSKNYTTENIDFKRIEDIHANYLFTINGKAGNYETTLEILERNKQ